MIKVLPPKTTEEVVARKRERKTRTTLLMALPEDHVAKFHKMADANEIWEAIKSRFGGNDESKKMQKYLLKQQFEGFSVSTLEGLHKGYDRFQTLLSQLEIHGVGLDTLSFDDLYNNLRVFERDVKGTTISLSSNTQNVTFVSTDNTSSTNDFDNKDPVGFDKTKVECFNCHKIGHFARDRRAKGNQDNRRRDVGYNGNKARDNSRRPVYQDDSKALVTIDGEDIDWSGHVEEDAQNYAMMAYSSSNSGSDNEVKSCSKTCKESYARLKKLYDEQRDQLGDASVEIIAYTLALKKSVFMNKESDLEDTSVNDRYAEGMHAVPPHMTENYMPSGHDVEVDYSKFTYGPKQTSVDESNSKTSEYASCESDSSVETTTSMPAPVENAPKVICKPKVWTDAPIIEEYESDSDNDSVSNVQEDIEKPIFAFTDSVKHKLYGIQLTRLHSKELASPKQTALVLIEAQQHISNESPLLGVNTPRCDEDSIKLKELMVLYSKLSNRVLTLEQSKTTQDLVIKNMQKKVKSIERKIKARTSGMTLFKIGNFKRKSLNKENVSKQGRYLKIRLMFKESDFDNIDDMVDEDND
uniref:Xylulose kinase-1 n=1 Tax=Tanacetum cinerariifolium TaxID=118510 RepID=A0A6L2M170_TANCI|nr:xylulose kinase-1 [Tanacetum cinerariifolium]